METTILPVKPNTLSKQDKAALKKVGIVVVECDEPSELRLMTTTMEMSANDMLFAAISAIAKHGNMTPSYTFVNMIMQSMEKARTT